MKRLLIVLAVLLGLDVLAFALALGVGSVSIPADALWAALTDARGLYGVILHELRLPRAVGAFTVGALLALAGALMQVLLRNPLADPYVLGVSGGAAVGALGLGMLGVSALWMPVGAFVGAIGSMALVFGLARRRGDGRPARLLLTGVVVASGWGALVNLLLALSPDERLRGMIFWLMGDLSQVQGAGWGLGVLLLAGLPPLLAARSLNLLAQGETRAAALGVGVPRLRWLLYFCASLLTAAAVTLAGSIGFVGLITPHLLRLVIGADHRVLLPASALLGGGLVVLADTLARTLIAPQQLPVGVVTALIGVPLFLLLLRRERL